ncbi:hypothetical protein [Allokutzneria oryzae]|uniref:DUF3040 domain-containing protein n=1 Tax=Allokutzneria oryzae TaxID=1378989 RepID=A0ABV5ZPQ5_9PSEU
MINSFLMIALSTVALASAAAVILRLRAPVLSEDELDRLLNELNRTEVPETVEERAAQQASLAQILADRPVSTSTPDMPPRSHPQSGHSRPRPTHARTHPQRHRSPALRARIALLAALLAHVAALAGLAYEYLGLVTAVVVVGLGLPAAIVLNLCRFKPVPRTPLGLRTQEKHCMERNRELPQ